MITPLVTCLISWFKATFPITPELLDGGTGYFPFIWHKFNIFPVLRIAEVKPFTIAPMYFQLFDWDICFFLDPDAQLVL